MPIYEYKCLKCNNIFSMLQSVYPPERNTECPKCASQEVKKLLSSFSCKTGSEGDAPRMPAPNFSGGGG